MLTFLRTFRIGILDFKLFFLNFCGKFFKKLGRSITDNIVVAENGEFFAAEEEWRTAGQEAAVAGEEVIVICEEEHSRGGPAVEREQQFGGGRRGRRGMSEGIWAQKCDKISETFGFLDPRKHIRISNPYMVLYMHIHVKYLLYKKIKSIKHKNMHILPHFLVPLPFKCRQIFENPKKMKLNFALLSLSSSHILSSTLDFRADQYFGFYGWI